MRILWIFFFLCPCLVLAQSWEGAAAQYSIGVSSGDLGYSETMTFGSAVDQDGNLYVGGFFTGSLQLGENSLVSKGWRDMFVIRYNPDFSLAWVRSFGSEGTDEVTELGVDQDGNIYVAGVFEGAVSFGEEQLFSIEGTEDVVLFKMNPLGKVEWAKAFHGTDDNSSWGIETDAKGNTYMLGSFSGEIDFGIAGKFESVSPDNFLAKINYKGECEWVRQCPGTYVLNGVVVDAVGWVYIAAMESARTQEEYPKGNRIYVRRYNPQGELQWESDFWAGVSDRGRSIGSNVLAIDVNEWNEVFVAGYFEEYVQLKKKKIESEGTRNAFVAKFSAEGKPLWANVVWGDSYVQGMSIRADLDGGLWLAGSIEGKAWNKKYRLQSKGEDVMMARFNKKGKCKGLYQSEGGEAARVYSMCTDRKGTFYLAGRFTSREIGLGKHSISAQGSFNGFAAKWKGE